MKSGAWSSAAGRTDGQGKVCRFGRWPLTGLKLPANVPIIQSMELKRLFVACVLSAAALASADIQWSKAIETPGPTPGYVDMVGRDGKGNAFATVYVDSSALWRWDAKGTRVELPSDFDSFRSLGRRDDFFADKASELGRYSAATGALLWRKPIDSYGLKVDEQGHFYVLGRSPSYRLEKRSYVTGNIIWTSAPGALVLLEGPSLLVIDAKGLKFLSKTTGEIERIVPSPVSGATLQATPMSNGEALVQVNPRTGNSRFYRLGATSDLKRLSIPAGDPYRTPGGGALIVGQTSMTKINATFAIEWSRSLSPGLISVDGDSVFCRIGTNIERYRLSDGAKLATFASTVRPNSGSGLLRHRGMLLVGGSDADRRAFIETFDESNGRWLTEWRSPEEGRIRNGFATAGSMPDGDLIIASTNGPDIGLTRMTATGETRWSRTYPELGWIQSSDRGQVCGLDISKDGSAISLFVNPKGSILIDPASGQIEQRVFRHIVADKDWIYKTTTAARAPFSFTSKFDRRTGKEIWRVPRWGTLLLDGKGSIYIGGTKNRIEDGQCQWPENQDLFALAVNRGKVFGIDSMGNFKCIDDKSGMTLWTTYRPFVSRSLGENLSDEIDFDGDAVLFRRQASPLSLSILEGANVPGPYSPMGKKLPDGYYRAEYVSSTAWALKRSTRFNATDALTVGTLSFYPGQIVECPLGGLYAIGLDPKSRLCVARYK